VDIEAVVRAVSGNVDKGQIVVAQLRKIGIRATLKTYESAAGFAVYGKGDFTLIAAQDRAMVSADPSDIFGLIYTTQSGSNFGRWSDAKVDELTDRGLRETNREKRKQTYQELQRYLLTHDPAAIPVAWIEGFFFRDKRVRNYKVSPTFYDHFTFMKVWLAQ
jgi:ABC-type transport system substrate-binding protein